MAEESQCHCRYSPLRGELPSPIIARIVYRERLILGGLSDFSALSAYRPDVATYSDISDSIYCSSGDVRARLPITRRAAS